LWGRPLLPLNLFPQSQALTFSFFKFIKDFPLIFYNKLKIVYYKNLLLKKFKKTEKFRPPPPFGAGKKRFVSGIRYLCGGRGVRYPAELVRYFTCKSGISDERGRSGVENVYIHEYNNSSSFCFFYATFANKFVLNSSNYLKKFLHKII
jgi:hypothetical protein